MYILPKYLLSVHKMVWWSCNTTALNPCPNLGMLHLYNKLTYGV